MSRQSICSLFGILLAALLIAPDASAQSRAVSSKTRKDLEKVVADFNTALERTDAKRLARCFDVESFLDRVLAAAPSLESQRKELSGQLLDDLVEDGEASHWTSYAVLKLHVADSGREATVFVRGLTAGGDLNFLELELVKIGNRWKLLDFFDLDELVAFHFLPAMSYADPQFSDLYEGYAAVQKGMFAISADDPEVLDEALLELRDVELPASMDLVLSYLEAMASDLNEDPEAAVERFRAGIEQLEHPSALRPLLGWMLLRDEKFEEALATALVQFELVGEEPNACALLASCYRALDRHAEALPVYAAGLELTPADAHLLAGFLLSSEDSKASARRLKAALELDAPPLARILEILEASKHPARVQAAAQVWIEVDAQAPGPRTLLARSLAASGADAEALEAFPVALELSPDETELLHDYLKLLSRTEGADLAAGMLRTPRAVYAFEWLANDALLNRDAEELVALMSALDEAHGAGEVDELPHRAWYDACLLSLRRENEEIPSAYHAMARAARDAFAAAGEIPSESPALYSFERCHVETAFALDDYDLLMVLGRAATIRDGDNYYEVIAHVLRGEHEQARKKMTIALERGPYDFESFTNNWKCRDILNTHEAYAQFRDG